MTASISVLFTCNSQRAKDPCHRRGTGLFHNSPGDVLLSQGAAPQVPSALAVLTSVFGMGTGVAPPLWSPGTLLFFSLATRTGLPLFERSIASTSRELLSKPSAD